MKILSCHRHDQALSISELRNCCFFVRVNNKPDIIIIIINTGGSKCGIKKKFVLMRARDRKVKQKLSLLTKK